MFSHKLFCLSFTSLRMSLFILHPPFYVPLFLLLIIDVMTFAKMPTAETQNGSQAHHPLFIEAAMDTQDDGHCFDLLPF